MNTSEQILVIFLSTALAVFLALAIVIAIQTIRLMRTLQYMADRAQEFVDSAEKTAEMVKSAVGQLSLLKFASSIFDMVKKHGNKKGGDKGSE
jgi:hypothetical protein